MNIFRLLLLILIFRSALIYILLVSQKKTAINKQITPMYLLSIYINSGFFSIY